MLKSPRCFNSKKRFNYAVTEQKVELVFYWILVRVGSKVAGTYMYIISFTDKPNRESGVGN